MNKLKIVFFGSPQFAVPSLRIITESPHKLIAAVTQPDKPGGRGQKIRSTAVKEYVSNISVPILQPVKLKDTGFIHELESLNADIFVVVAYRILPGEVFEIPPKGTINLHPSLLPKYRGAAPIHWTIINGEKESGATTIRISSQIDAGGILLQRRIRLVDDETAGSLHDKLALMGAELLAETLDGIADDRLTPKPQDDRFATPAPKITREMQHISFHQPAAKVRNWIHGLSPHPAAYAVLSGKIIKIYRAQVIDEKLTDQPPGTVVKAENHDIFVACKPGVVALRELQREGRKKLSSSAFLRGFNFRESDRFS